MHIPKRVFSNLSSVLVLYFFYFSLTKKTKCIFFGSIVIKTIVDIFKVYKYIVNFHNAF